MENIFPHPGLLGEHSDEAFIITRSDSNRITANQAGTACTVWRMHASMVSGNTEHWYCMQED